MAAQYYGKLLVSLLLITCSGRIFFIKRERMDNLSTLCAVALIAAVLQVLSHGLDAVSASLCIVSVFSFFTNIHALSRLAGKVFIDHYNPLFIVFSLVSLVLSLFLCFVTVYFAETAVSPSMLKQMHVEERKVRYTVKDTLARECAIFEKSNAQVAIYERQDTVQGNKAVAILATDKRAGTAGYAPYMAFLAEEGFTVITGEFDGHKWFPPPLDARMFRRLAMVASYLFDNKDFERQREFYTFAIKKEYETLLNIADKEFGQGGARYLISDDMSQVAARTLKKEHDDIDGVFELADVLTAPGLGFVQQTDPLLAWHLHLKRDKTLDAPRTAAKETALALRLNKEEKDDTD